MEVERATRSGSRWTRSVWVGRVAGVMSCHAQTILAPQEASDSLVQQQATSFCHRLHHLSQRFFLTARVGGAWLGLRYLSSYTLPSRCSCTECMSQGCNLPTGSDLTPAPNSALPIPKHHQESTMEQTAREKEKSGRQRLIESITEAGSKAFNPDVPESLREQAVRDFDDLIQRQAQLGGSRRAVQV